MVREPARGPVIGAASPATVAGRLPGLRGARPGRRLLLLLLGVIALAIFHQPLLRAIGGFVVVEQLTDHPGCVVIWDGDRRYQRAAELYHSGKCPRILLVERHPNRLVRLGVLPSSETEARRELKRHRVPAEAIEQIPGSVVNHWQAARVLQQWLRVHPADHLTVFSRRFNSKDQRYVLDQVLGPADAARVSVYGLPDRLEDETRWWQSKRDLKGQFLAYLQLAYDWCQGEPGPAFREWDFDAYQQSLLSR